MRAPAKKSVPDLVALYENASWKKPNGFARLS